MNDDLPSSPGCLSKFSFCAQAPCKKLMKNYANCAEQCLYLLLFVQKRNIALCKVWSKWTLGRHQACCFLYLFETLNICKILITITKEKEGALFVYKQTFFWVSTAEFPNQSTCMGMGINFCPSSATIKTSFSFMHSLGYYSPQFFTFATFPP